MKDTDDGTLASALEMLTAEIETASPSRALQIYHALTTLGGLALGKALERLLDARRPAAVPARREPLRLVQSGPVRTK